MLYIEVPDMNDSISTLSVDGKEYGLRFTYNEKYDDWSFGIYDEDGYPIEAMVKIVPNFPLLHFCSRKNLPDGIWGCLSQYEKVGRNSFKERTAEFIFIPNIELEE